MKIQNLDLTKIKLSVFCMVLMLFGTHPLENGHQSRWRGHAGGVPGGLSQRRRHLPVDVRVRHSVLTISDGQGR